MNALRRERHIATRDWHAQCAHRHRPVLRVVPKPEPKPFFYRALGPYWQLWLLFGLPIAAFFLALDVAVIWCWITQGAMQ